MRPPRRHGWQARTPGHAAIHATDALTRDAGPGPSASDPDDADDGGDYYYLVTALSPCGGEGPTGFGWNGRAPTMRPPRRSSALCP